MYVLPLIYGNQLLQVIAQSMDKTGFVEIYFLFFLFLYIYWNIN